MARANSAVGMFKVFSSRLQKADGVVSVQLGGGLKFQFAKLSLKPMIMIMIYMINTLELVLGSFSTEVFKKSCLQYKIPPRYLI